MVAVKKVAIKITTRVKSTGLSNKATAGRVVNIDKETTKNQNNTCKPEYIVEGYL
jgi:hypothetical protein